jgi:DNA-binding NarL/FixJ family response regulator
MPAKSATRITPREQEIIQGLLTGKPYKQLAFEVGLTEGSLKVCATGIYRKLGVQSRLEFVVAQFQERIDELEFIRLALMQRVRELEAH